MQKVATNSCSTSHAADAAAAEQNTEAGTEAKGQVQSMGQASADSKQEAKPAGASNGSTNSTSSGAFVKYPAGSKSVTAGAGMSAAAAAASAAFVAAKLGLGDQLEAALVKTSGFCSLRDAEGRCCLHYAAGYGHEECVDLLLAKGGPEVVRARDSRGDLPLHMAAQQGHPMCTYNLAKACTASCMAKNKAGHSPIDVAAAAGRGEVLNAMLLACSGDGNSAVSVAAMRLLLAAGAVPDTWAPNGSSALMLAASANGVAAVQVLLEGGATLELQDALGRTALMFGAGSDATAACNVLLEAHASLSARDRRGRAALDYAPAGSESAKLLQKRLDELESVASKLQQQLLQEGSQAAKPKSKAAAAAAAGAAAGSSGPSAGTTAAASSAEAAAPGSSSSSASKKKTKKKGSGKAAAAAAATPAAAAAAGESPEADESTTVQRTAPVAPSCKDFSTRSFAAAVGPAGSNSAPAPADRSQPSSAAQQQAAPSAPAAPAAADALADRSQPSSAAGKQVAASAPAAVAPSGICADSGCPQGPQQAATGAAGKKAAASVLDTPAGTSVDTSAGSQGRQQAGPGAAEAPPTEAPPKAPEAETMNEVEWQVVAPKGKHRAATPPGPQGGPGSNTPRNVRAPTSHNNSGSGLHQQVLLSAAGVAAGSSSGGAKSGPPAAAAAAAAGRHRRQGSAHSICSTLSLASCDSSSCSAGSRVACAAASSSGNALRQAVSSPRKAWGTVQQRVEAPAAAVSNSSKPGAAVAKGGNTQQQAQCPVAAGSVQQGSVAVAAATPASAAAAGGGAGATPRGFKAALLKAGQDGNASCTATPTAGTAPGAAFAAALQASLATKTGQHDIKDASNSSNSSSSSAVVSVAAAPAEPQQQQQLQGGAKQHDRQGSGGAEAAPTHAVDSRSGSHEAQVHAAVGMSSDTGSDHQSELQQLAGELLQARADLAAAQLQLRQQATALQQQLAAVLEDAAAHEGAAVQAAVEAAVAETLQSPMLLQVLATGVQQAVLKERTNMQVRLVQAGLPPSAVLQILTQPPPPPGATLRAAQGTAGPAVAQADSSSTEAEGEGDSVQSSAAAAAGATVNGAPVMAQMLSVLASSVLASSAAGGSAAAQQQLHLQQMVFLQRLRQQQQEQQQQCAAQDLDHASAVVPDFQLDLRSEYNEGGSAFVVPARTSAAVGSSCEGAAAAILKLHTDRGAADKQSKDDAYDATARELHTGRRSSSGCSSMSALEDAPVADVASAAGCFFGTIGCNGGATSSSSPHSSSECSSAFAPTAQDKSPPGGSCWGDVSRVGSPALGTSPLLGPAALPLGSVTVGMHTYSSSYPRTSPLSRAGDYGCPAPLHTQWGFSKQQQGVFGGTGVGVGVSQHVAAAGDGRRSLDSARLVAMLPDEL